MAFHAIRLDPDTLLVVLIVSQVVNLALSAILLIGRREFPGAGWWLTGQLAGVTGIVLNMFFREGCLALLGIVLGNALIFAGSLCLLEAVWRFRTGRPLAWPVWLSVPVFLLLMWLLIGAEINTRVVVYSVFVGAATLAGGLVLVWRVGPELRLASWLASLAFFLALPVHAARAAAALLAPALLDAKGQGNLQSWLYLLMIFSVYLLLYGYFLLASMRHERELRRSNQTNLFMMQVIAHDLRNPVHAASRYLERHLLRDGVDLQSKRDELRVLARTIKASGVLLDNLLAWAEMRRDRDEAGKLEILDPGELVGQALVLCQDGVSEKNIALVLPPSWPPCLADHRMAASVLRNILSNAVRHTPEGSTITLGVEEGDSWVELSIADQGPGIDAELLSKLRSGDSLPRLYGDSLEAGNSLGLILCHRFMALQGGSLGIESELGKGSRFSLRFRKPGW